MDFFAVSFVVDIEMHSFCLLTSVELILVPNCSLLHVHSNNMNSLINVFMKKINVE